MARTDVGAMDHRFYRAHYGLGSAWKRPLARMHYRTLGRRRGWQPHPLFDAEFFTEGVRAAGLAPPQPPDLFSAYLEDTNLWGIDPHPDVFFPEEPFASAEPSANPLLAADRALGDDQEAGAGHPLLDPTWWLERHSETLPPGDRSLGAILRHVAVQIATARTQHDEVQLGPDLDVLFINGEEHCPACTQYRVWTPALALRRRGLRVSIVDARDLPRLEGVRVRSRCAVFFRALGYPSLVRLAQRLRAAGTVVGFDCDDLLFGALQSVGIQIGRHGTRERDEPNRHLALANRLLEEMDFAFVPTATLAQAAQDAGFAPSAVAVLPSFLSPSQVAAADHVVKADARPGATFVAASGTWTHHDDFRQIARPLASVLADGYATIELLGSLSADIFPELAEVSAHVLHDPAVVRDWSAYIARYFGHLASLVPLDLNNGFCHAKSEVKYMEAGLVGCATIASPTEAYQRALQNAPDWTRPRSEREWRESLAHVVNDHASIRAAGDAAHRDVRARYGPDGSMERLYFETVTQVLDGTFFSNMHEGVAPSRWSLTVGQALPEASGLQIAAARQHGADSLLVHREPREDDLWQPLDGSVLLESGTDPASRAVPWVDPLVFFPRSASVARDERLLGLITSPDGVPHAARAARTWRAWSAGNGFTPVVLGADAAAAGLPRGLAWAPGASHIELATLLRSVTFAVVLDLSDPSEVFAGALATQAPIVAPGGDAPSPWAWRLPEGWGLIAPSSRV